MISCCKREAETRVLLAQVCQVPDSVADRFIKCAGRAAVRVLVGGRAVGISPLVSTAYDSTGVYEGNTPETETRKKEAHFHVLRKLSRKWKVDVAIRKTSTKVDVTITKTGENYHENAIRKPSRRKVGVGAQLGKLSRKRREKGEKTVSGICGKQSSRKN